MYALTYYYTYGIQHAVYKCNDVQISDLILRYLLNVFPLCSTFRYTNLRYFTFAVDKI